MLGRNSFPSKILLFGEYTIIRNSNALAVPFELFEGSLVFPKKDSKHGQNNKDGELFAFSKYLKNISLPFDDCSIDTDSFSFDVSQGLTFESSIPQGYGVGSSGALCSAIFQRYGQAPMNILNDPKKMNPHHWRFLSKTIWSDLPALQVLSIRILRRLALKQEVWATELLDSVVVEQKILDWSIQAE